MSKFINNCKQFINPHTKNLDRYTKLSVTPARKIAYGALLASLATILQSAGMLGGLGLLVSALSTLPILIGTIISLQLGFLAYITALFLIAVIQPSELFAFPFTTGLMGLSMGFALRFFKNGFLVAVFSGLSLTLGILFILLIIKFPILGPVAASNIDFNLIWLILLFSIFYSWIWMKGFLSIVKKSNRLSGNRTFD